MLGQGKSFPPEAFLSLEPVSPRYNGLWFLLVTIALVGCISLYSSSSQSIELVARQVVWFLVGFGIMFALTKVSFNMHQWWIVWVYFGGILLLLAVHFFGDTSHGAQRWLDTGIIRFQPSEFFKIIAPLMICFLLTSQSIYQPLTRYALALGSLALPVALILKQPDLGTAVLISIPSLLVIFLSGISLVFVGVVLFSGIAISIPVIKIFLLEYQRERLWTFLDPDRDPLGAGYHIIQSKIAIGAGGLWGKGWRNGTQSQLDFIPEISTDFIFATFAEEFGFVGVCILFLFYFLVIAYGIKIALNAKDKFARLLAASLIVSFALYVFINIGMVSGIMPVVGMPLPLMSYGGTAVVTLLASFGILLSISKQRHLIKPPE